jgi:hypothetical protein
MSTAFTVASSAKVWNPQSGRPSHEHSPLTPLVRTRVSFVVSHGPLAVKPHATFMESMASGERAVSNGTLPVTLASATPGEIWPPLPSMCSRWLPGSHHATRLSTSARSPPAVGRLSKMLASGLNHGRVTCSRLDLVRVDEGRPYKNGQIIEPISHAPASRTYLVTYILLRDQCGNCGQSPRASAWPACSCSRTRLIRTSRSASDAGPA